MPPSPEPLDRHAPQALLAQSRWLRAFARTLVADDDADDLCQEALLAAVARPAPAPRDLRAWLAGVLRRLAAQRHRAAGRRQRRERLAARDEALPSTADVVARAQLQHRVVRAVLALPEPYRTTLLLRHFDDLPPAEVARATGVPVETARTRIKRGLAMVRARLDEHDGRAAWAVPLAAMASARHFAPAAAAGASAGTVGALVMSGTGKAWVAACAAVLVATAVLVWRLVPGGAMPLDVPATGVAPLVAAAAERDVDAAARAPERVPVEANAAAPGGEVPIGDGPFVVTGTLLDEETMTPVAGGEVRLVGGGWFDGSNSDDRGRAESAADGTFRVAPRGAGDVRALRLHVRSPRHGLQLLYPPWPRPDARAESTVLVSAVIDVGRVLLSPGTGVRGRVVDDRGRPVAGAEVFATTRFAVAQPFDQHPCGVLDDLLPLATTDAGGAFTAAHRLAPLAREHLLVAVAANGIGYAVVPLTRERRELDAFEVRLRPTARLTVSVRDARGAPLAGARVRCEPRFLPFGRPELVQPWSLGGRECVRALFATETDAAGRAELPFLPIGEGADWYDGRVYDLVVEADGSWSHRERIVLEAGGALHRDVTPSETDTTVVVTGTVRDSGGWPIAGALVRVAARETRTDGEGSYRVVAVTVAPTDVDLPCTVSADGYAVLHTNVQLPQRREDALRSDFALAACGELRGVVVDQHGSPVAGATVVVRRDQTLRARTEHDGTFRIQRVPLGEEPLIVSPPGPPSDWAPDTWDLPRVRAGVEPVRIVLHRLPPGTASLTIEVVDATTQRPIAVEGGGLLPIEQEAGFHVMPVENRIGVLRYERLRPGRYRLMLQRREPPIVEVPASGADTRVRVEVGASGVVHGQVVFDDVPAAMRPAKVRLTFGPDAGQARWVAPPSGGRLVTTEPFAIVQGIELDVAAGTRFRLDDVDPSRTLVVTLWGEGVTGQGRVQVAPGGTAELRVRAVAAGAVALRFAQQAPVAELELRTRPHGEEAWAEPRRIGIVPGSRELAGSTIPLPVGRHEWRIAWRGAGEAGDVREVGGEVAVTAGRASPIVVDFARGTVATRQR